VLSAAAGALSINGDVPAEVLLQRSPLEDDGKFGNRPRSSL
jgi:hypothetical protein